MKTKHLKRSILLFLSIFSLYSFSFAQDAIWAKPALGSDIISNAIAVDAAGNTYITGKVNIDATFYGANSIPIKLTGTNYPGATYAFIAKYDPAGNCIWAKPAKGTDIASNGIAVDASGNTYITGRVTTDATFYGANSVTIKLTNAPSYSGDVNCAFTAKYDPNGNCIWAKPAKGTDIASNGIAVDASGSTYITGRVTTYSTFYGANSATIKLTNAPSYSGDVDCAFTAKYDPNGNCIWAKPAKGTLIISKAIAVDACSNVFITGRVTTDATFYGANSTTLRLTNAPSYSGDVDCAFTAKYINNAPTLTLSSSANLYPGSTGTFTYTVNNPSGMPLTYQWQHGLDGVNWRNVPNSLPYSGVNTPALTITNAPSSIAGHQYRLLVTGICFSTTTGTVYMCNNNVAINTFNNVCITDPQFNLAGGTPTGGTYYIKKTGHNRVGSIYNFQCFANGTRRS